MTTVRETFRLACPLCGGDDDLQVTVAVWVDLWPNGTTEADRDADHFWDDKAECRCRTCNHYDIVANFTVDEH